jgi:signal transduction histidine kinase
MAIPDVQYDQDALTILLVDSDAHDRELCRRAIGHHFGNANIHECDTAAGALAFLHAEPADCILIENVLPDSNGIDFLLALRREVLAQDSAVIMITAHGDEQTAVAAMKLGAKDYLVKSRGMEQALAQTIAQALDRVRHQREVIDYRDRLELSHRAMSEFAHTASHDLKAPLRRIMSYCDLLAAQASERLTAEEKSYIERLGVNAHRMRQLVDDLLVFSTSGEKQESRQPCDVSALIAEVLDYFGDTLEETGAEVLVGAMPPVNVYPVACRQLFQNLIGNALKYRRKAVPPHIEISYMPMPAGHMFTVRDNGIGIAKEHQENIFKTFTRLHRHDDIEGTGLGLSICKKVVEMHGGRIWVDSAPGQGAAFNFTLNG